ncbi:hypothetical protein Q5428_20285 [Escherichia coli]|nr:hypothetical protein [Escherichia coli]MDO7764641.1 hypothetical protein [Escherichia coli]
MAHDVPLGCAPDEYDDLISGTCSHLPKLSHSEMIEDNKKDLAVNDHGLTCPSTTDCSDRCSDYINPEHKKTIKALQDAGYLK